MPTAPASVPDRASVHADADADAAAAQPQRPPLADPLADPLAPVPDRSAAPLSPALLNSVVWLLGAALVVAALYFGRDILVPFALAALLAFVLDPLVTWARRGRLPRPLAVGVVLVCTVAVLSWVSVFVAGQAVALGRDLPTYQSTVQQKLRGLRQQLSGRGVFDSAGRMLEVVDGELDATRRALDSNLHGGKVAAAPLRVQVQPAAPTAVQALSDLASQVLGPLALAGLVLVFLVFILLERHDLRDRLLRLVGGDLQRTTAALDEAAQRVSRYLTMQVLVNTGYALPLAAGLWLIGVPGALLWGALGGLLRFVPYIGPLIAALFPLTLAFAVDPGWQMLLWTGALIVLLELVINNMVEPWLYGHSTGLAPTAVLVAAAFWTALWGPIGLLLATPITVCLVTMGRHLPHLQFLDLLLGRDPVFDHATRLHQRLLAGDTEDAIELALAQARDSSPQAFYQQCALPVLQQADDRLRQGASAGPHHRLLKGMQAVLAEMRLEHPPTHTPDTAAALLCVGGRSEPDTLAASMLAHALQLHGLSARSLAATAVSAEQIGRIALDGVQALCLSQFSHNPAAQARYVCRRLRRLQPGLHIVLVCWNAPADLLLPGAAAEIGADAVVTHLDAAVAHLQGLAPVIPNPDPDPTSAQPAGPSPDAGAGPHSAVCGNVLHGLALHADAPQASPALP